MCFVPTEIEPRTVKEEVGLDLPILGLMRKALKKAYILRGQLYVLEDAGRVW